MHSAALFKSMQALGALREFTFNFASLQTYWFIGFYCALPAEPTRTHMECNRLPGSSR